MKQKLQHLLTAALLTAFVSVVTAYAHNSGHVPRQSTVTSPEACKTHLHNPTNAARESPNAQSRLSPSDKAKRGKTIVPADSDGVCLIPDCACTKTTHNNPWCSYEGWPGYDCRNHKGRSCVHDDELGQ
jgi:hypothetical protein